MSVGNVDWEEDLIQLINLHIPKMAETTNKVTINEKIVDNISEKTSSKLTGIWLHQQGLDSAVYQPQNYSKTTNRVFCFHQRSAPALRMGHCMVLEGASPYHVKLIILGKYQPIIYQTHRSANNPII